MDKFAEMQALVAVVDAGSFVKAAQALNQSKTAVSRLVADLEARLGVRLLHRTTRRLSLTHEGERFVERCRDLLGNLDDAEAELSEQAGEVTGELRINAPLSFGLTHLAPLWPRFMALHPGLRLDITLSDRVVDLVEEGDDLAIRIARLPSSTLVSRKLTTARMILCASPDYLQRRGVPAHPSELAQHAVMTYTLLARGEQWEFEGPEGPVAVKVSPVLRSNSGDTCVAAALRHQGLVLQPEFLVGAHLKSGALVEVLPDYRAVEFGVYAVYPTRKHLLPRVRALIEFLTGAFRG